MKSKVFLGAFLGLFVFAFSLLPSATIGQVRFREFREDKRAFEHYAERAKVARDEAELESILRGAHAFLSAAWERDAEWKISEAMRKEGDGEEIFREKSAARAEWEAELEAEEAKIRGSWLARREAIVRLDFDRALLEEALVAAKDSAKEFTGKEKLSRWDASLAPKGAEIDARWEEKLAQVLSTIRARGDALDAAAKGAFEKEVREIESELRAKFRLEKHSLIYRERNRIIRDELLDLHSLRASSERGKASAIADDILARTVDALEKRKHALVADVHAEEGASSADFSNLGENWEARLRELVEAGLLAWKNAQQEFISRMATWKQDAEKAFSDGDDEWRKAYEKLARAQESWQKDLQNEINTGIEEWKKRDQELSKELERAKQDLDSYLATTDASWEEYSAGVLEALVQGAEMHGEAGESIDWLQEMAQRYNTQGVYSKTENLPQLYALINGLCASGDSRFKDVPVGARLAGVEVLLESMSYDDVNNIARERYGIKTVWEQYFIGNYVCIDDYGCDLEYELVSYEAYLNSSSRWKKVESRYITTHYEHSITEQSPQKTLYYYYMREASRWKRLRDEIGRIVSAAERSIHEATMLGIGGPGFLRNVFGGYGLNTEGENEPYLMTEAEKEYELARREREYWAKRLEIAEEVLNYATKEGPREDAEITEARKNEAKNALEEARLRYEESLKSVQDFTEQMARTKGKKPASGDSAGWDEYYRSIEYLAQEIEKKKWELEKAEGEYKIYADALIVLENGQDASFMDRMLIEIQNKLFMAEKELVQKRREYFEKLRLAEGYERLKEYSSQVSLKMEGWIRSKKIYEGFKNIVEHIDGSDDDTISLWGGELLSDNNAYLWERRESEKEQFDDVYKQWMLDKENGALRNALLSKIDEAQRAREASFASDDTILLALLDENFNPAMYVEAYNQNNLDEYEQKTGGSLKWKNNLAAMEALKTLCAEHEELFVFSDTMARAADFESAMVAYVEDSIGNGFRLNEEFEGMSERDFADAARAMCAFVDGKALTKWFLPSAMKELSAEMQSAERELSTLLYVREHASDGNFREDFAAKKEVLQTGASALSFGESVMTLFDRFAMSAMDAVQLWNEISTGINSLENDVKAFIAGIDGGSDFMETLATAESSVEYLDMVMLSMEFMEAAGALGLEEFIAEKCEGRSDSFIASFRAYLEAYGCIDGQFSDDDARAVAIALAENDANNEYSFLEEIAMSGREVMKRFFSSLSKKQSEISHEYAKAEKLVEYHDNPTAFTSYRNFVRSMWKDTNGAALSINPVSYPKVDFLAWMYAKNPLLDVRAGEGELYSVVYGQEDTSGRMLDSMIIDAVNKVAGLMRLMRESAKMKNANDENILDTMAEFAQQAKSDFEKMREGELDANEFEVKIAEIASSAQNLALARGISSLASLKAEVESRSNSLYSQVGEMRDLSRSSKAMSVGKEQAQANFLEKSKLRDEKQKEFSALSKALEEAQGRYKKATDAYIDAMNETARRYKAFKDREYAYEKAYAVWEYAHTPYLIDTAAKGTHTGEGEMPGGEKEALAMLNPADARERYKSAKEAFDTANAVFLEKKEALETQERVEDLSKDEQYRTLREEFKTEAESHARFDRAATLLAEQTALLAGEVELLRKKYAEVKDSSKGFIKTKANEGGEITHPPLDAGEILKRDAILGRMLAQINAMGMEKFIMGVLVREHNLKSGMDYFSQDRNVLEEWYCPPASLDGGNGGYINTNEKARIFNEYNALKAAHPAIFDDIDYLRNHDIGYSTLIAKVAKEYYAWKSWYKRYREAESKCNDVRKWWCNNARHRRREAERHKDLYVGFYSQLVEYLSSVARARNELDAKEKLLASFERVKSAEEFRSTTFAACKIIDNRHYLALEDIDRSRIFDESDGKTDIGKSDVNISSLRKKSVRKDIDGNALKGRVSGGMVYVLTSEGKLSGESYELWRPFVLLASDEAGANILSKQNLPDGDYYLVDYVYSATEVARTLASKMSLRRSETKNAFETYAESSVREGKHDSTVVHRDREALYNGLMNSAATIGDNRIIVYTIKLPLLEKKITIVKNTGSKTSRRYAGYKMAVNELLYSEESVSSKIVKSLIDQSVSFQKQDWDFTITTYQQKKKEWMEAAAFIRARGERDWAEGLYSVQQAWRRWRIDTREKIEAGEKKWDAAQAELAANQKAWASETAIASAEAASKLVGEDIAAEIRKTVETINAKLPGNIALKIDGEKIYADAMKTLPKADIGALSQSMANVSTTFGISEIINLGLSNTMYEAFQAKVKDFESGMKVMKNLRMGEVVLSMMKSFEEQLKSANEAQYDMVFTGLAANIPAPFERDTQAHQWKIRVVTDHSLVSTTYRTRSFEDYKDFINTTVKIKDIRTLKGGVIDFYNPDTYNMIDSDELEMYVALETDHLRREIDRVLSGGESGEFGAHAKTEFDRLQNEFTEKYTEYMKGEALMGMGWYRTPIVPNGPDPMTAAKIGGSIAFTAAGMPWGAFILNGALTCVDVKDGMIAWKHAATQFGVGLASSTMPGIGGIMVSMAATGIDYEKDGSVGWDNDKFREGISRQALNIVITNTVAGGLNAVLGPGTLSTGIGAGISTFVTNSLEFNGDWKHFYRIGWDEDNWQQHLTEGVAAGIAAMASKPDAKGDPATGEQNKPFPNIYGDQFVNKIVSGGINSLVMTAGYHAFGGDGFEDDMYSKFNWQSMTYSPYDLGSFMGGAFQDFVQKTGASADDYDNAQKNWHDDRTSRGSFENARQDTIGFFERTMQVLSTGFKWLDTADRAIKGAFSDLGEIAATWLVGLGSLALEGIEAIGDGIASLWNGVKGVVSAAWNGVTGLFERSHETNWAEMMKDKSMQDWVVKMIYKDKNFAKMAEGLGLNPQMNSDLKKQALVMRKEEALENWNKALDPKNMKKVGGNYEIMLGDTKLVFAASKVECPNSCGGQKINQMLNGMDKQWATVLYDMTLDNNIKSMVITSIYYNKPANTGHDTGKSLDIDNITFNDGSNLKFLDSKNAIPEPKLHEQVFNWLKNDDRVLDAYSPWQIFKNSYEKEAIDIPNTWGKNSESVYKDSKNKMEYRMWTHRHHLHLRLL